MQFLTKQIAAAYKVQRCGHLVAYHYVILLGERSIRLNVVDIKGVLCEYTCETKLDWSPEMEWSDKLPLFFSIKALSATLLLVVMITQACLLLF